MTTIELCIKDDGSMYVETGEKEETPDQEQAEGGQQIPVKSIDEALQTIKQIASQASMGQEQGMGGQEETGEDQSAPDEEEQQGQAMAQAYRPGTTGRG